MARYAECGFLTMQNPETRSSEEVDEEAREKGIFPSIYTGRVSIGLGPRCFRMAADLGEECSKAAQAAREADSKKEVDGNRIYPAVITKDRECQGFTEWHPGFSPKEHREMLFDIERNKLEMQEKESERNWQERREKEARKFQLANTLISALAGAIFTAIVSWLWSGKNDTKPNQPVQAEKPTEKPSTQR